MCCVDLLTAVVKRCAWPDDPDRAMRGGFVIGRTEAGHPIYRNPATPHLLPLLPGLLSLMKVFNALWTPEALAALSEVRLLTSVGFIYLSKVNTYNR